MGNKYASYPETVLNAALNSDFIEGQTPLLRLILDYMLYTLLILRLALEGRNHFISDSNFYIGNQTPILSTDLPTLPFYLERYYSGRLCLAGSAARDFKTSFLRSAAR
jgi:hypothetical protein